MFKIKLYLRLLVLGWSSILMVTAGCSDLAVTRSGFLKDYSHLKPFEFKKHLIEDANAMIYERPGVDWSRYTCAIVEPVTVEGPAQYIGLNRKDQDAVKTYLRESLESSLGKNNYVNVDHTPQNAIRVRAAITDIDTSEPLLNFVTMAAMRMPVDTGGSSIEIEVFDAVTNEPLCKMTAYGNGNVLQVLQSLDKLGQAKLVMDHWTERFAQRIKHDTPMVLAKARQIASESAPF